MCTECPPFEGIEAAARRPLTSTAQSSVTDPDRPPLLPKAKSALSRQVFAKELKEMVTQSSWSKTMRVPLGVLAVVLATSGMPLPALAHDGAPHTTTYGATTLSQAKVSQTSPSSYVVTLEASGDLRGLLTLKVEVAADGSASGQWALKIAHLQDLYSDGSPAPQPEPHEEGVGHTEHIALVDKGTLGGPVSSAFARFEGGDLAALEGIELDIVSGSLEYDGATGNGSAQASGLQTSSTAVGSLLLSVVR
jgi:hypothetical protein